MNLFFYTHCTSHELFLYWTPSIFWVLPNKYDGRDTLCGCSVCERGFRPEGHQNCVKFINNVSYQHKHKVHGYNVLLKPCEQCYIKAVYVGFYLIKDCIWCDDLKMKHLEHFLFSCVLTFYFIGMLLGVKDSSSFCTFKELVLHSKKM